MWGVIGSLGCAFWLTLWTLFLFAAIYRRVGESQQAQSDNTRIKNMAMLKNMQKGIQKLNRMVQTYRCGSCGVTFSLVVRDANAKTSCKCVNCGGDAEWQAVGSHETQTLIRTSGAFEA